MTTQITLYGGQFDGQSVAWPDGAQTDVLTGDGGTLWTYVILDDPTTAVLTSVAAAPPPVPPEPDPAAIILAYQTAAQTALDTAAQGWGYDSLLSAASYVNSAVPRFRAEAAALIAWRDALWPAAFAIEVAVFAGELPVPENAAAFVGMLPAPPDRPAA